MNNWKFTDPPELAVIAAKTIVTGNSWIAFVLHEEEDDGWQFLDSSSEPLDEGGAVIVGLGEIVALDPSINELSNLPIGWCANRSTKTEKWKISKYME